MPLLLNALSTGLLPGGDVEAEATCLRAGGARLSRVRRLPQAREEQRLVDPSLEDRDAQLHTPGDHLPALQSALPRKLCGREVICHWLRPPWGSSSRSS